VSATWSRRRLLGATLGLAGSCGVAGLAPRVFAAGAVDPGLVVVQDGRYARSRQHADELAPRARQRLDTRDDLARLWYAGLRDLAARTPLRLTGLTTWSDYLVMRGCAAEVGLRATTHRMVGNAGGNGCTLVHWRIGGPRA
jgi:hypothetical protein